MSNDTNTTCTGCGYDLDGCDYPEHGLCLDCAREKHPCPNCDGAAIGYAWIGGYRQEVICSTCDESGVDPAWEEHGVPTCLGCQGKGTITADPYSPDRRDDCPMCLGSGRCAEGHDDPEDDDEPDLGAWADGDALASAGWGCDEDYCW